MSLHSPLFLFLIPLTILVFWLATKTKSRGDTLKYPLSFRSVKWQAASLQSTELVKILFRFMGLSFLIFALARPQTSESNIKSSAKGIDIMLTLDVSKSMTIEDYDDLDRLTLAKSTIKKFIKNRQNDRIGFVEFSGESVTLCPPTLDYQILEQAVNKADTDSLKDGTAIGDAIANSVNRLKDSTAKSRIIILVTDGDSNMGSIAPLTAGSLAQGYGIKIYAIALGREGLVNMPVYEDFFGQTRKVYQQVNSTINPELLQKIAKETGGKFFRASEKGDLAEVFKEIDRLEKSQVERKERIRWHEEYQIYALIGLLLLALEFVLSKTYLRVLPD